MATETIITGVVNDDTGILQNVINPMPPFVKAHGLYCEELVVGTDFTSGNTLVFQFEGSDKILFAIFVTNVGALKGYVEAAIGGGITGQKLTVSAVTTNLKCLVYYNV